MANVEIQLLDELIPEVELVKLVSGQVSGVRWGSAHGTREFIQDGAGRGQGWDRVPQPDLVTSNLSLDVRSLQVNFKRACVRCSRARL